MSSFKQYLASFIDTTVRPWRLVDNAGAKLEFSAEILAYFERAHDIRRTFFQGGSNQPNLSFQVMPLQLDAAASQSLLELGDQRLVYQHGPLRLSKMVWPPSGMSDRARFTIKNLNTGNFSSIAADGPWAWFRLIDKGGVNQTTTRDRFRITFDAQGLASDL